ncbi:hypothetical protein [Solitalea lacus]|uniref:hypothetical protein n=1 Tax=Solitalea lacus TaxID=2911172 RepID=UPI001EDC4A7E|nr:hypothetical protein [Solitalea lacus]UKJ06223.1 hypothetical protein L2B55_11820 [Solitalea lacus]
MNKKDLFFLLKPITMVACIYLILVLLITLFKWPRDKSTEVAFKRRMLTNGSWEGAYIMQKHKKVNDKVCLVDSLVENVHFNFFNSGFFGNPNEKFWFFKVNRYSFYNNNSILLSGQSYWNIEKLDNDSLILSFGLYYDYGIKFKLKKVK